VSGGDGSGSAAAAAADGGGGGDGNAGTGKANNGQLEPSSASAFNPVAHARLVYVFCSMFFLPSFSCLIRLSVSLIHLLLPACIL
jgi:hypothetical protein